MVSCDRLGSSIASNGANNRNAVNHGGLLSPSTSVMSDSLFGAIREPPDDANHTDGGRQEANADDEGNGITWSVLSPINKEQLASRLEV